MTESVAAESASGYRWPPAEPGNTLAVKHGARSPRIVGELSAALLTEMRASGAVWVDEVDRGELESWAFAEATCALLREWLTTRGHIDGRGKPRNASDLLLRWERQASRCRAALGLNPSARAALGRDAAIAKQATQAALEQLAATGRKAHQDAIARGDAPPEDLSPAGYTEPAQDTGGAT